MKKISAVILSLSLILTMVPFNVFASEETPPQQVEPPAQNEPEIDPSTVHLNGVTEKEDGVNYGASISFKEKTYYYKNIESAFADAIKGDIVKVERSIALSDKLCLYPKEAAVLDLNGKTITCGNNRIFIGYDGTDTYDSDVTITDSAGGGKIAASINQTAVYVSKGTLTFAGGDITNTYVPQTGYSYGIYATRNSTVNITGGSVLAMIAVMARPATVNVKGGSLTGTFCAGVYANGSDGNKSAVNMDGGTVYCSEYAGVYGDDGAEISIKDGTVYGKYGLFLYDKTEAVMDGGTVSASDAAAAVARTSRMTLNGGTLQCSVLVEYEGATFVMNGGTIATEGNDIAVMGNAEEGHGGTEIIINGGTIISDTTAVYLPQEGKTTIKGGSITGAAGIEIKGGKLKIDPITDEVLTVTAKGIPYVAGTPSSNLDNEDGVAVAVIGDERYSGNIDVDINGGTFSSNYGIALWAYQPEGKRCIRSISIKGGSFDGGNFSSKEYSGCAAANLSGFISGGSFSTDPADLLSRRAWADSESGIYKVSDAITFTGEKTDISRDESAGTTETSVIREGRDKSGSSVTLTEKSIKNNSGSLLSVSEKINYEYTDYVLTETKETDADRTVKAMSQVEIRNVSEPLSENAVAGALELLEKSRMELISTGAESADLSVAVKTSGNYVTFARTSLEKIKAAGSLNITTALGSAVLDEECLGIVLEESAGESISLSADTMELIKARLVSEAEKRECVITSVKKTDSRPSVKWKPADGADGYVLTLISGGKTYTAEAAAPDASSYRFEQKVTKAYRVKVTPYTVVMGEKIEGLTAERDSVVKPVVTKISKSSKTKKVTVKWKKASTVDGYVVKLIYKGKTYTKTITKNSTVKYTFSKKVYSSYKIKIKSYAVIEGKKVYSGEKTFSKK